MSYIYGDDGSDVRDQNAAISRISGVMGRMQLEQVTGITEEMPKMMKAAVNSTSNNVTTDARQQIEYLAGDALKCIENLGHSAGAYEASKNRLERKFGGLHRRLAIYIEQLEGFRSIQYGNAKDVEEFSDLLDVAIINLRESRQYHELGTGSLYVKLQRKLPEMMLARYHRWIFENNHLESVETLRDWIVQEAEFQTVATETIKGIYNSKSEKEETQ